MSEEVGNSDDRQGHEGRAHRNDDGCALHAGMYRAEQLHPL
jgi:hypothetical protein